MPTDRPVALCIERDGNVDLQVGKMYCVRADARAREYGQMRVFDDSGEDYLYPAEWFHVIRLPRRIAERIRHAAFPATPRTNPPRRA